MTRVVAVRRIRPLEMEGNNEGASEQYTTCLAGCRDDDSCSGVSEIVELRLIEAACYGTLRLRVVSGYLLDLTKTENEPLALVNHCVCVVSGWR